MVSAQEESIPTDSLEVVPVDTIPPKKNGLDAPVNYQAKDSIVMTADNWAFLYGEGSVKYQNIELEAELIQMNMDSSLVNATFALDTAGLEFGYPLFKEGEQQYESKTMRYNFGSKKGYITDVITQQGEGFVTSGRTKKMPSDVLNMAPGRYTTCDEHDHPHFYIHMTKAKVRPKKDIVTGPVYLVLEDVPLYPIGLPFAFFPFTSSYSSGILMPTFGEESSRGFFLRDGGYYFALSDYMDLALTGEIYTKGSWGLAAKSSYRKRYKYSGNFNLAYQVSKYGDVIKGQKLPDYSLAKDFKINWSHSQDPKSNPFLTFSASVNFATSSFDRNNEYGHFNGNSSNGYGSATENTKGSTVNITKRFPNNPFSISGTMSVNQRMKDSSLAVTLPDLTVTMSRIFPFKRKSRVGAERWYEKISMQYTGYLRNSITTKEDQFLKASLVKDWKNAMQHKIPVSATFSLFNYINITPTFNYTERWYSNKVEKEYDPTQNALMVKDTTYGFYRVYDYNASVSASTTVYGNFKPWSIFGDAVQMIRHRLEPSISFSAAPDFGDPSYGFYKTYLYEDMNGIQQEHVYSPFEGREFGIPSKGKQGSVSFSVSNNVEAKIRSDKDSTGFKKISLIDKLTLGISNNLAADSFQWSDISASLRLKFSKSYTLNLNAMFDTYTYRYDDHTNSLVRQNKTRWEAGKGLGRLRSTGTSFSYTFNNDTFSKLFGGGGSEKKGDQGASANNTADQDQPGMNGPDEETATTEGGGRLRKDQKAEASDADADGYYVNTIPWSLSFNYSMNLNYDNQKIDIANAEYKYKITHALSFNGNIQPTKNWRFNFNATYDFDNNKLSYMTCNISRTLHCWQMTASFVPVGPYKTYSFSIAVNSSLLKDLKWDQRSNYRDGQKWY